MRLRRWGRSWFADTRDFIFWH